MLPTPPQDFVQQSLRQAAYCDLSGMQPGVRGSEIHARLCLPGALVSMISEASLRLRCRSDAVSTCGVLSDSMMDAEATDLWSGRYVWGFRTYCGGTALYEEWIFISEGDLPYELCAHWYISAGGCPRHSSSSASDSAINVEHTTALCLQLPVLELSDLG